MLSNDNVHVLYRIRNLLLKLNLAIQVSMSKCVFNVTKTYKMKSMISPQLCINISVFVSCIIIKNLENLDSILVQIAFKKSQQFLRKKHFILKRIREKEPDLAKKSQIWCIFTNSLGNEIFFPLKLQGNFKICLS